MQYHKQRRNNRDRYYRAVPLLQGNLHITTKTHFLGNPYYRRRQNNVQPD